MPLVQAKCTNCGANLEVDSTKKASICNFCETAFIIEKAINNYNISNNITASVVNIYGDNSPDFAIRAGILEKYNGASSKVVIPNTVTSIGECAFSGCSGLTKVTIPVGIKSIESSAFCGCTSLITIDLPDGVESICSKAFAGCTGLEKISIPDSVTSIEMNAFENCKSLKAINLPENITTIMFGTFSKCSSLSSINIPETVSDIGLHAFYNCTSLNSINIPYVKSVGSNAFEGCINLEYVEHSYMIKPFIFLGTPYYNNYLKKINLDFAT